MIFDECGFTLKRTSAKKGEASVGVARQWNGRLGKVDNCQVGVFATLCRGDMATLVDTRLYLPEDWCHDEARCKKAAIPRRHVSFSVNRVAPGNVVLRGRQRAETIQLQAGYNPLPPFCSGSPENVDPIVNGNLAGMFVPLIENMRNEIL